MSTRAMIVVQVASNRFAGVYLHNDGATALPTLAKHYNSMDKAVELIQLGGLSSLHDRIAPMPGEAHSFNQPAANVTVAYHRDRGEHKQGPRTFSSEGAAFDYARDNMDAEYMYLYSAEGWKRIGMR